MECDICSKRFGKQRQPTCPSCARASIYGPRLEQVSLLLDKEKLHSRIQTVLKPPSQFGSSEISTASQFVELTESARKVEVESQRGQIEAIEHRLEAVREQHQLLRAQIAEAKERNNLRRSEQDERRLRITAAGQKLDSQSAEQMESVIADCKRLNYRLGKVQKHTMEGRRKLCIETALLSGLDRHRGRRRDGKQAGEWYSIGKIPISDLRELNTMHPDMINASLAHISRLLITTAHYLAIRLPAEILAPHANSPRPAILSLHSSYHNPDNKKQRPLFVSKPLPLLAKEDTPTYNLFIDGVVLLAYDVAWVCRMQGVGQVEKWEDLTAMGANLYRLFLGDIDSAIRPASDGTGKDEPDPQSPLFGEYSHANGAANLISLTATERLATWSMPSLARVEDRLKSHLLTEMSGAEWEMLDEKEWEEERDDERAVLVGGARWSLASHGAESRMGVSYMTATPAAGDEDGDKTKDDSAKGWMKLKMRSPNGKQ